MTGAHLAGKHFRCRSSRRVESCRHAIPTQLRSVETRAPVAGKELHERHPELFEEY